MPEDKPYLKKIYNFLNTAYGKDGSVSKGAFTKSYDDFEKTISSSDKYANKIYGALSTAYGPSGVVRKNAFSSTIEGFKGKVLTPVVAQQPTITQEPMATQEVGGQPSEVVDMAASPTAAIPDGPVGTLLKGAKDLQLPEQKQPGLMADQSAFEPLIAEKQAKEQQQFERGRELLLTPKSDLDPNLMGQQQQPTAAEMSIQDVLHKMDEQDKVLQTAQQEADEFAKTTAGGLYYSFVRPVYQSLVGSGGAILAGTTRLAGDLGETFGLEDSKKILDKTADGLTDYFDFNRLAREGNSTGYLNMTPTTQQGKLSKANILPKAMESITSMATLIGGGRVLGGNSAALFTSNYLSTYEEFRKQAKDAGLSSSEADQFAITSAGVNSALLMISPETFLGKSAGLPLAEKSVFDAIKRGVPVKQAVKNGVKNGLKTIGEANAVVLSTDIANRVIRTGSDLVTGQNNFNQGSLTPSMDESIETGVLTTIAMGALNGRKFGRENTPSNLERSAWVQAAEKPELIENAITKGLESNTLQPAQAERIRNDVAEYSEIYKSLKEQILPNNPNADLPRLALDAFKSKKQAEETKPLSSIPGLRVVNDKIGEQQAETEADIQDAVNGVPENRETISSDMVKTLLMNQGEGDSDKISDNDYKSDVINLDALYKNNKQFREFVDQGNFVKREVGNSLDDLAVINENGDIVNGLNGLAQKYVAGEKATRALLETMPYDEVADLPSSGEQTQSSINVQQPSEISRPQFITVGEPTLNPKPIDEPSLINVQRPQEIVRPQTVTIGEGSAIDSRTAESSIVERTVKPTTPEEAKGRRDAAIAKLKQAQQDFILGDFGIPEHDGNLLPSDKSVAFENALISAIREELGFRGQRVAEMNESTLDKTREQLYQQLKGDVDISRETFDRAFDSFYNEQAAPLNRERQVVNNLFDGTKTTTEIVRGISELTNDAFIKKQIESLLPYIEANQDVRFSRMFTPGVGEAFLTGDWTVKPSEVKDINALSHAVVHELYHAISLNELFNNTTFQNKVTSLVDNLRKQLGLTDYFKDVNSTNFGSKKSMKYYGLINEAEFIAEIFSNKEFSALVDKTPLGEKKPILSRVIDFVKSALGIKAKLNSDKIREMILSSIDQKINFEKSPTDLHTISVQKGNARPEEYNYSPRQADAKFSSNQAREAAKNKLKEAYQKLGRAGFAFDPKSDAKKQADFHKAVINYVKEEILYRANQVKGFAKLKKAQIKSAVRRAMTKEEIKLSRNEYTELFDQAYSQIKKIPGVLGKNVDRVTLKEYFKGKIQAREKGRREGFSEGKKQGTTEGKQKGLELGERAGKIKGASEARERVKAVRSAINEVLKESGINLSMLQKRRIVSMLEQATTARDIDKNIERAIDATTQMVWEQKHKQQIEDVKKQIKAVNGLKKSKTMVLQDVEWLKQLQLPLPSRVDDLSTYQEMLKDYISSRKGDNTDPKYTREEISEFIEDENLRIYKEKQAGLQEDLDGLKEKGILPDDITLDEYIATLDNNTPDKLSEGISKKAELLRTQTKTRLGYLKERVEEFDGRERSLVKTLSEMDIKDLEGKDLIRLNNVLNNIAEYGTLDAAGDIVTSYEAKVLTKELASSGDKLRPLPADKILSKKNLSNYISALFYNDAAISRFRGKILSGIETKVAKTKEQSQKIVKEFVRLNKEGKINGLSNAKLHAYSYLNQYRGIESGEIADNLKQRLDELIDDASYLFAKGSKLSKKSERNPLITDATNRLAALAEMGLIDYKVDGDAVKVEVKKDFDSDNPTKELEDIYNSMTDGQKKVYDFVRKHYDEISDDLSFVTRTYAGKEFQNERNYVSLVARPKNSVEDRMGDISGETDITRNFSSVNAKPSNTTISRSNKKAKDLYYDGDFFSNFVNRYYTSLYTTQVLPELQRAAKTVNSKEFRDFLNGKFDPTLDRLADHNYVKFKEKLSESINEEKYAPYFKRGRNSIADRIVTKSVRMVLGNVWQGPKQYVPALIHNFTINDASAVSYALASRGKAAFDPAYAKSRNAFLKLFTGVQRSALGSAAYDEYVRTVNDNMSWWMHPLQLLDKASKASSFVLEHADKMAQNDAYISSYVTKLIRDGKIKSAKDFDIVSETANPDKEALAYAEQMASNINNESAKAYRPEVLKDTEKSRYLWLLQGFSLNAYQNAMNKLKIVSDNRSTGQEKKEAMFHFMGYMGEIGGYQLIGLANRGAQTAIAAALLTSVFGLSFDETEEDKKNKRDKEKIKTAAMMGADFALSGQNAVIQTAAKASVNYAYQEWAKIQVAQKKKQAKSQGGRYSPLGTYLSPFFKPYYGAEGPGGAAEFYLNMAKKAVDEVVKAANDSNEKSGNEDKPSQVISRQLQMYLGIPATVLGSGDLMLLNMRMQVLLKEASKAEKKPTTTAGSSRSRSSRSTRSRRTR